MTNHKVKKIADTYPYQRKFCKTCNRYDLLTGYCPIFKKVVAHPDEPNCSWWTKETILNKVLEKDEK